MRVHLSQDGVLSIIGTCLKAADYHAARGDQWDFYFWSAMADEFADIYCEYGAAIQD
jgi:hypothetical protein